MGDIGEGNKRKQREMKDNRQQNHKKITNDKVNQLHSGTLNKDDNEFQLREIKPVNSDGVENIRRCHRAFGCWVPSMRSGEIVFCPFIRIDAQPSDQHTQFHTARRRIGVRQNR